MPLPRTSARCSSVCQPAIGQRQRADSEASQSQLTGPDDIWRLWPADKTDKNFIISHIHPPTVTRIQLSIPELLLGLHYGVPEGFNGRLEGVLSEHGYPVAVETLYEFVAQFCWSL